MASCINHYLLLWENAGSFSSLKSILSFDTNERVQSSDFLRKYLKKILIL